MYYGQRRDKTSEPNKGSAGREEQAQQVLVGQFGRCPTTVTKWVTNTCQLSMETFVKIAKLLDVELTELIRM